MVIDCSDHLVWLPGSILVEIYRQRPAFHGTELNQLCWAGATERHHHAAAVHHSLSYVASTSGEVAEWADDVSPS